MLPTRSNFRLSSAIGISDYVTSQLGLLHNLEHDEKEKILADLVSLLIKYPVKSKTYSTRYYNDGAFNITAMLSEKETRYVDLYASLEGLSIQVRNWPESDITDDWLDSAISVFEAIEEVTPLVKEIFIKEMLVTLYEYRVRELSASIEKATTREDSLSNTSSTISNIIEIITDISIQVKEMKNSLLGTYWNPYVSSPDDDDDDDQLIPEPLDPSPEDPEEEPVVPETPVPPVEDQEPVDEDFPLEGNPDPEFEFDQTVPEEAPLVEPPRD